MQSSTFNFLSLISNTAIIVVDLPVWLDYQLREAVDSEYRPNASLISLVAQGEFHNGVMHGQGRFTWNDGVVYEVRRMWNCSSRFFESLSHVVCLPCRDSSLTVTSLVLEGTLG